MLILQRPWDSQPQEAILPASAWALDGVWFPGGGSGVVSRGTAVSVEGSAKGLVWSNVASTTAGISVVAGAELPTTECTVIFGGTVTTTGTGGDINTPNGTAATKLGGHFPFTDGKYYFDFGGNTAGTTRVNTAASVTRSSHDVIALTAGPRGMEIWQNGILLASNTATPTRTASTNDWGFQPQVVGGTRPPARWWMLALSSRQASPQQLSSLVSPEAAFAELLKPRCIYIPTSITSGGAYTLNLETGIYSFTGSDAVLLKNSQLTLDSGSYSLTGSNASLLKGLILEASSGTYTLSGSNASLLYTHLLSASNGTYTINGADATLTYTPASGIYTLNAETGTYLLTGSDVTFIDSGSEVTIKAGSWIRYRIIT